MMRRKQLCVVAFLACLLSSFGFIPSGAQEAKPEVGKEVQKVVAVMPFANLAKDTGLDWLGEGIAETMTTKLSQVPNWTVVERSRLDAALKEIVLGQSGVVDDSTAAKAGKMLGAATMVIGAYQKSGESVRLTARSVEVASGKVLKASEATGKMDEIFALEDRLATDILAAHGLTLKPEQLQAIQAKPTADPAAYELANRAEMATKAGNLERAALLLRKAIAKDSTYAQAVFGLAKVEERMGHLRKAQGLYLRYLELAKAGHEPVFRVKIAQERSQGPGSRK